MTIPSRPLEFYGVAVSSPPTKQLRAAIEGEQCPFVSQKCGKIRKSDASQTIGACLLGHGNRPLIICPRRLLEGDLIFRQCLPLLKKGIEFRAVPEIRTPGGSVDYFLVSAGKQGKIIDFVGIELQSLDTTGTGGIWSARQDCVNGAVKASYSHGINWKMSAKTILVQMLHKAPAMEALDKKLVLVVQEEFLAYIESEFTGSVFRKATLRDSVHFHTYSIVRSGSGWSLRTARQVSTSAAGVAELLMLGEKEELDEKTLIQRIQDKMKSSDKTRVIS